MTRTNSRLSKIVFEPGVSIKTCSVKILDDALEEGSEVFSMHLVTRGIGAKLDEKRADVYVTIEGPNDGEWNFVVGCVYVKCSLTWLNSTEWHWHAKTFSKTHFDVGKIDKCCVLSTEMPLVLLCLLSCLTHHSWICFLKILVPLR